MIASGRQWRRWLRRLWMVNLESLKSATLAAYPNLKEEDNLDFGYNLAVFPDDPVKLAKPEEAAATTNPFLKFAKDLTNPMNANAGK